MTATETIAAAVPIEMAMRRRCRLPAVLRMTLAS